MARGTEALTTRHAVLPPSFGLRPFPAIRHRLAHSAWMIIAWAAPCWHRAAWCQPRPLIVASSQTPDLSQNEVNTRTAQLADSLRLAHAARRGVPPDMEATVRAYARAQREAGADIGRVLVEVKALVRANTGSDEPIFTPRIIGWTVASFFHGTSRAE